MPSDWLFYWMTLPLGLAVIALAVGLPFLLWRRVLGSAFANVGFKPLAVGYSCAALGLVVLNFISSYAEFSSRVSKDILPEVQRWSTVPGWTIYITVLSLIVVLPLVGLVGVPFSALLIKLRHLSITSITLALIALWLSLAFVAWTFPGNDWHRTHRLESLAMSLKELLPSIGLVAMPFLLGIHRMSRTSRHAGT